MLIVIAVIPVQAFAAENKSETTENDRPTSIINSDGEKTNVADEWEQAYPYGVFAFGNYAAATAAVYLTDSSGNIVQKAVKGDQDTYSLTLYWNGMIDEQLSEDYTISLFE